MTESSFQVHNRMDNNNDGPDARSGLPASHIELSIEELVLDGFSRAGRYQIAEALEREMVALIEARGLPVAADAGDASSLIAPEVHVQPDARPDAIGRQIARAVYEGLERCSPTPR
jgi:hypothetical protein